MAERCLSRDIDGDTGWIDMLRVLLTSYPLVVIVHDIALENSYYYYRGVIDDVGFNYQSKHLY